MRSDAIQVLFRSGARNQEAFPARILAADMKSDLALLKVERSGCRHLTPAPAECVVETMPVVTLGFPFGALFSVLERGPEISVNRGYITSLRHDDRGTLEQIQFDAAVNPGNSGGPLVLDDGRVLGVTNIAIGSSRVNFAVPVIRLVEFMKQCPADRGVGRACKVHVASKPAGAKVYLNSKPLGETPLNAEVEGGYQPLEIAAPDHCLWAEYVSLYDGKTIEAELKPRKTIVLEVASAPAIPSGGLGGLFGRIAAAAPETKPGEPGQGLRRGKVLFSEGFDRPEAAEAWRQDTGGDDKRTWYVQNGAFHQFQPDGLLHAVFAGKTDWADYAFSARVRIESNEADGRAGLIFRATDEGFALFRLHRQTSRVQLAYHSNNLFGWQILAERPLPFVVKGDAWHEMEVQALGDQIVCLLDGKVVLQATNDSILRGDVGFYSVDSRASFDDARVTEVSGGDGRKPGRQTSLSSFWVTDQFARNSGLWRAVDPGGAPGVPWPAVPGGCIAAGDAPGPRMNILDRYDVYDGEVRCLVSAGAGTVGLVFRHDDDRRYLFAVDVAKRRARLVRQEKDNETELAAADLSKAIAATPPELMMGRGIVPLFLRVRTEGNKIQAGVNNDTPIAKTDDVIRHGRIGFYTLGAKAVFHNVTVASPLAPE